MEETELTDSQRVWLATQAVLEAAEREYDQCWAGHDLMQVHPAIKATAFAVLARREAMQPKPRYVRTSAGVHDTHTNIYLTMSEVLAMLNTQEKRRSP